MLQIRVHAHPRSAPSLHGPSRRPLRYLPNTYMHCLEERRPGVGFAVGLGESEGIVGGGGRCHSTAQSNNGDGRLVVVK